MNIIIGLTESEGLAKLIRKYISVADELSKNKSEDINKFMKKLNDIENEIMTLMYKNLVNDFKINNDNYEKLDKELVNSELRGEVFSSVNNKQQAKQIYNEIVKVLSSEHEVSNEFKKVLKEMKTNHFLICWNLEEEKADELL